MRSRPDIWPVLYVVLRTCFGVWPVCICVDVEGLAVGDLPGNQPIGIVLTVLGVVVLDFCLDALDGPIRSYLLDVADGEEQDMALNIHAFAAGNVQRAEIMLIMLITLALAICAAP